LAVVPANVDIHNTEILQAARKADPNGDRTLNVITKPDLVDPGSESSVLDLINNKVLSSKLGYHVVKCRGQIDLNNEVSIEAGRVSEANFFKTRYPWSTLDWRLTGTEQLVTKLSSLLEVS
jgi:interferon-induced GTP-binding protein Mx